MDRVKLAAQLEREEGKKSRMYLDTENKWTIGIGFNLSDCAIPESVIYALLDHKINEATAELDRALPWWRELDEVRQTALAHLCYQLGISGLLGFKKALELLKSKRFDAAAAEFLDSKWQKQCPNRAQRVTDIIRKGEF